MKLLKFTLCVLIVSSMIFCCSCGLVGDQKYECNVDEVTSIQIVRLDKYIEDEYRFEYTVLSQIPDCRIFADRLNEIKHSVNWGDPCPMYIQYIVIKIDYHNGDFDLVHQDAQCFNRSGANHYGYFFFDDQQFNSLISDYLEDNQRTTL